jgi:hypothetical protein
MDRILTTFAANGQPFLAPTSLDMLQDAYKNGIRELSLAQIGSSYDATVPYILWGCESVTPVAVSEGGIFFNGEVFYTAGWSSGSLPVSPLVLIASISTTYAAVDPITYEDGSSHNTHSIRTCVFSYGGTGTGTIGDFTDFVRVNMTAFSRVNVAAAIGSPTIALDRNKIITYNTTSATSTITLDDTKSISGREVYINCVVANSGDSIAFSGTYLIVNQADPFIVANSTQVLIKIKSLETGVGTFTSFIEIYNPA